MEKETQSKPDDFPIMINPIDEEKASLMKTIDGESQLPIAHQQPTDPVRSRFSKIARAFFRLGFFLMIVAGFVHLFESSPFKHTLKNKEVHNPLRYYPVSNSYELPIPTSIPTSIPHPPSPPKPPHPPSPPKPPHHLPKFPHPPPPPRPQFPHHPEAIECLDISDAKAAVNISLTLHHPWSAIHLDHSLTQADISIRHETSSEGKELSMQESHQHGHGHGPSPPPPGGAPPPPPHHGPPHHGHEEPKTVMVTIRRSSTKDASLITSGDFSDTEEEKENKVFVCSLKLPFFSTGLGLFHEPPKKHEHGPPKPPSKEDEKDDEEKEPKEPKEPKHPKHKPFPAVSLAFRFPEGAPFNIKSGLHVIPPPPPPPFGHHHHHHHHDKPWWRHGDKDENKKGFLVVITKMVHRVGCAGRKIFRKMD